MSDSRPTSHAAIEALNDVCVKLREREVKAHIVAPIRADGLAFGVEWLPPSATERSLAASPIDPKHFERDLLRAATDAHAKVRRACARHLGETA